MGQQETPESSLPLELAIQARFIAAYSNRRPEDIGEEERKDFQAFWNRTPDAFADLIRASVSDNAKMMMKYGMDTTITTLTFNGADLKEAYSQYDKDGQKKVMAALDERNHVFTREYIQAEIYPCMKHGFLDKLSDKQKKSICSAISLGREPSTERGKFNLFLVLYEMADDDRRMQMAQCIDLPANEIGSYIQVHPRPDNVVFEDARNETHEIHTDGPNDADASDLNGEKANGMQDAEIRIVEDDCINAGYEKAKGLVIGTTFLDRHLPTVKLNEQDSLFVKFSEKGQAIPIKVTRPMDEDGNSIRIYEIDTGIMYAIDALKEANTRDTFSLAQIYRQWAQNDRIDVTEKQVREMLSRIINLLKTTVEIDSKTLEANARYVKGTIPVVGHLLQGEILARRDGDKHFSYYFHRTGPSYLWSLSIALGYHKTITDRQITDIGRLGEARDNRGEVLNNGVHSSTKHKSKEIFFEIRDAILRLLLEYDGVRATFNGDGSIKNSACTGEINLLKILKQCGREELTRNGREHKNAYKARERLATMLKDYLAQLKSIGRIKEYEPNHETAHLVKGGGKREIVFDYTVTTIPPKT